MKKLFNILKGWYKFLFAKRSQMAKDRLIICFSCKARFGIMCGMCGCELHAKAEIEEEECPLGKWSIMQEP
jgi:hypothetical protein